MVLLEVTYSSVQFSRSVVSNSLRPHELQQARPPCPSPTSGVHANSCPSSRWCHPAISSSVIPFSSCPQSLPASESFPMSQLRMRCPKYWSFSFSIIPSKEHPGLISFRMDWLDLLAVQGTLKNLLQHYSSKASGGLLNSSLISMSKKIHGWMNKSLTWIIKLEPHSMLFNSQNLVLNRPRTASMRRRLGLFKERSWGITKNLLC